MDKIMWWGYQHQNGSIQVKRWFGDHKDYTEDCVDNDFVVTVVRPFEAQTRDDAIKIIMAQSHQLLYRGNRMGDVHGKVNNSGEDLS